MTKRKTSVIGFPRIGKKRELKFTSESFFKGDITEAELRQVAADLRHYGWKKQKDAGIAFIPSNDFSFYDNVLDTAFTFGVIPARYRNLGLGCIETYFAASHGYQGEKGDVKALPMKKWFNTNYHYIEPEIDDNTVFAVNDYIKPVEEYNEAKAAGYQTVPVLTGAFTFLSLARYTGSKRAKDFVLQAAEVYAQVALKLSKAGAEWVSFAEPSLVLELNDEQRNLFKAIYTDLIGRIRKESGLKILLQTYFGDIREAYSDVIELGFDGIGLDFIEGHKTLELIQNGFPKDVLLFAGIVNGKNIWRANYTDKLELIKKIEKSVHPKTSSSAHHARCYMCHIPWSLRKNCLKKYYATLLLLRRNSQNCLILPMAMHFRRTKPYLQNRVLRAMLRYGRMSANSQPPTSSDNQAVVSAVRYRMQYSTCLPFLQPQSALFHRPQKSGQSVQL